MTAYSVDRARLEGLSTAEILRILSEEEDDYTPEALEIFREILESRGALHRDEPTKEPFSVKNIARESASEAAAEHFIRSPADAVVMLNNILGELLEGKLDPHVAQAASQIIMSILRAMEQEFMTEPQEES
jgi:hypothetical protein